MSQKKRILVVDDDDGFRALVTRSLRNTYIVLPASDGEEAFDKALELRPDAILLDLDMPGWDGVKTLREIRRSPALRNVPVVALSADHRRETIQSVIIEGASDYLLKEAFHSDPGTLPTKLRQLVATQTAL